MKEFLLIVIFLVAINPVQSYTYNQYGGSSSSNNSNNSVGSSYEKVQPIKIYDKNGSLQGYVKPQQNGTVKTYDKYNSYTGYYKKSGSQTRYYPKK